METMRMNRFYTLMTAALLAVGTVPASAVAAGDGTSGDEDEAIREALDDARERLFEASREFRVLQDELRDVGPGEHLFTIRGDRAMLGINLAARESGDRTDDGVYVAGVTPGGPADEAGLEAGDVIMRIDDIDLGSEDGRSPEEWLVEYLDRLEPGTEVELAYRRGEDEHQVAVTTEALGGRAFGFGFGDGDFEFRMPGLPGRDAARAFAFRFGAPDWAEMELVTLSEELGRYFGTDEGLLVVRAPEDELLGLQDGDVILGIGGRDPKNPNHAMRILNSYAAGETLELEIMRDGDRRTLEAVIPEEDEAEHLHWDRDSRN